VQTPRLDEIDCRVLDVLQADGRISNVKLAERLHLSPSAALRRHKGLERSGAIDHYQAVLNRSVVGLGLTIFVDVKVSAHSADCAAAVEAAVETIPEVVSCHIVSGEADFLMEVVVPDLAAYERVLLDTLLRLPNVSDVRSNFAIRTLKAHGSLPLGYLEAT
jgi:Lrp/AsnC family transcriptional regulator, leucine-responsive regulatory protein